MKYCKNCQTPYDDDAQFCVNCGATEFLPDPQNAQAAYAGAFNSGYTDYNAAQSEDAQYYTQDSYGYGQDSYAYAQGNDQYTHSQNSSIQGNAQYVQNQNGVQYAQGQNGHAQYGTEQAQANGAQDYASYGTNGQAVYIQNVIQNAAPVGQLKTNRGLLKFILLSIVTLGIYALVYFSSISTDINIIASRYDGKKTTHFCLMAFILAPITLTIYMFVWYHKLSARIGSELQRRGIDYHFSAADFWLWDILGSLILVGPFIYIHKLSKAMNLLAENYNQKG